MRGLLTLGVIVAGLLVVLAVFIGGPNRHEPAVVPSPAAPATGTPGVEPSTTSSVEAPAVEAPAAPSVGATPAATAPAVSAAPATPIAGLRARSFDEARVAIIGSTDKDSGYKIEVDLSAWGASIMRAQLTDYRKTVGGAEHYVLVEAPLDPSVGGNARVFPLAAKSITLNGATVSLLDVKWELRSPSHYRTTYERRSEDATRAFSGSAEYALTIVDEQDKPVVELIRTYSVAKDSYHIGVSQRIINRTDKPLNVVWDQRGIGDISMDEMSYMGDRRTLVAGYRDPTYDPKRNHIYADHWTTRDTLMPENPGKLKTPVDATSPLWPNDKISPGSELTWIAAMNRYFLLVLHPVVPAGAAGPAALTPVDQTFPKLSMERKYPSAGPDTGHQRTYVFEHRTGEFAIPARQTHSIDVGLFAGPRHRDLLKRSPNDVLQLGQLIKYELGCSLCTFQWLAHGLLAFLDAIHTVVRDWGVAIIILVLVVRLILHPITKKSQVNMMVMGKQMQSLQPEIEKLKKKYGDDQQKFQAEQLKLWREKGINPAGMLGCLPMFLQMPIWVALYAMLFLAIELRHQPAFYGLFQMISGWEFMGDLSSPDAFIRFSDKPVHIPFFVLSSLDFSTLNILPILWTVVMFYQQKYTTPPPATEQQAQQQKMMKWMTLFFPLFLYSAPSGLTLYILASTSAGIVDSYYVRKHIKDQEARGELLKPKKPRKSGGMMDRLAKAMEAKQREMMERKNEKK